jgi:secreted trypsin-like serine protease
VGGWVSTFATRYVAVICLCQVAACGFTDSHPVPEAVVDITVDGEPWCLGALLSSTWVLSAKHCVQLPEHHEPLNANRIEVMAAESRFTVIDVHVVGSRHNGLDGLRDDLALLQLSEATARSPLSLGVADTADAMAVTRANGQLASSRVSVRVVEPRLVYTDGVTCVGDSGGPLMMNGRVVGIASWRSGAGCEGGVSVYTRTDTHAAWVTNVIYD